MSKDYNGKKFMQMVFEGANPNLKTIFFSIIFMIFSIAVAAQLLNVNVGSILQRYADLQLEYTRTNIEELKKQTTVIKSAVERVHDLSIWACKHDTKHKPSFCHKYPILSN